MKINIVYESKFGNGRNMLDELVQILKDKKHEVELFKFIETAPGSLPAADFYVFHSPTRQFMLPLGVRSFLKRFIPPAKRPNMPFLPHIWIPALLPLKNGYLSSEKRYDKSNR